MHRLRILANLTLIASSPIAMKPLVAQDTIRVVANNAPEWGSDARLVQRFAIGDVDGPPETAFGRPVRAAVEDGRAFYLFDDNDQQIRRYDARGVFERKIGRKGGGPGEYQSVASLHVTRDGLLVVYDPASTRISYFRTDGKLQREITNVPRADWEGFATDINGLHYLKVRSPGPFEGPDARYQHIRLSPAGAIVDSIRHAPDILVPRTSFGHVTSEGMRVSFIRSTVVSPWLGGGTVTAHTPRYSFWLTWPGRPVLRVERPHKAVPLLPAEREDWLARAAYMKPRSMPGTVFDIPRVKPALRDLFSDDQGRIWVEVYVTAERHVDPWVRKAPGKPDYTWRERATFDVFSPEGRYLGRLQLPWQSKILTIGGDHVLVLTKGEEGEPRVVMYEIARG